MKSWQCKRTETKDRSEAMHTVNAQPYGPCGYSPQIPTLITALIPHVMAHLSPRQC